MGFVAILLPLLLIGAAVAIATRRRAGAPAPGQVQQSYDAAADAGAEAHRWLELLGGSLSTLDARGNQAARQALADADVPAPVGPAASGSGTSGGRGRSDVSVRPGRVGGVRPGRINPRFSVAS
jgi:hypothetical protein